MNTLFKRSVIQTLFSSRPTPFFLMTQRSFATNEQMRIYADRVNIKYPANFGKDIAAGPQMIEVNKRNMPVRIDKQSIPLNDYINFKKMLSGNEILLNLDNCDNLRNGELISGLIELGKRDKAQEFDWNSHPIVTKCLKELKHRLPRMNAKNVV